MKDYIIKFRKLIDKDERYKNLFIDIDDQNEEDLDWEGFIGESSKGLEVSGQDDLFAKHARKRDSALWELVNFLPLKDIHELVEDILTGKEENLSYFFSSPHWSSIDKIAFNWLASLPYATAQRVSTQIDDIFEKALGGNYKDNEAVIKKILAITSANKIGLSDNYIKNVVKNKTLDKYLKLDLLIILAQLEEKIELSFVDRGEAKEQSDQRRLKKLDAKYWETELDIKSEPYLAPAILAAFSKQNPKRGIEVFLKLDGYNISKPNQEEFTYFEIHTLWILNNWLMPLEETAIKEFKKFRKKIQSIWIQDLIDGAFDSWKLQDIRQEISKPRIQITDVSFGANIEKKTVTVDGIPISQFQNRRSVSRQILEKVDEVKEVLDKSTGK